MTKPLELYVTLFVPENLLSFCCSRYMSYADMSDTSKSIEERFTHDGFENEDFIEELDDIEGQYITNPFNHLENNKKYKLNKFDPQRLDNIIQMVKSATDAQLKPETSVKNDAFEKQLKKFNATNPDGYNYSIPDIVRMIGRSNYKQSWIAIDDEEKIAKLKQKGKNVYDCWEFHEFEDIDLPGFSTNNPKTKLYVKIVAPFRRQPDKFSVMSVHNSGAPAYKSK